MGLNKLALLFLLIFTIGLSSGCQRRTISSSLEFKLACDAGDGECEMKTIADSLGNKKEMWFARQAVMSLEDVDAAEVVKPEASARLRRYVEDLKRRHAAGELPKDVTIEEIDNIITLNENWRLLLTFRDKGKLEQVTASNIKKQIGIFINGDFLMAPKVMMPIVSGQLEVTDNKFSKEQLDSWAKTINDAIRDRPK